MIFSNYCYITSPRLFKKNEPDTKQRDQFNSIYENEDCAGKNEYTRMNINHIIIH